MIATFFYTTRTVAVIATCFLLLASQCAGPVGDDPQCLEAAMRPASFWEICGFSSKLCSTSRPLVSEPRPQHMICPQFRLMFLLPRAGGRPSRHLWANSWIAFKRGSCCQELEVDLSDTMNQLLDSPSTWFLSPRVGGKPNRTLWANSWTVLQHGFCHQELEVYKPNRNLMS